MNNQNNNPGQGSNLNNKKPNDQFRRDEQNRQPQSDMNKKDRTNMDDKLNKKDEWSQNQQNKNKF